jgi:hypothetical protein
MKKDAEKLETSQDTLILQDWVFPNGQIIKAPTLEDATKIFNK